MVPTHPSSVHIMMQYGTVFRKYKYVLVGWSTSGLPLDAREYIVALWLNPGCDAQVSEWVVLDLFSPTVDKFDFDSQVLIHKGWS